ncbi:MAG: HGxxPAAW family protein [Candidatus Nanopelagicales bacterium]
MSQHKTDHGNTPAAWTAASFVMAAFVIGTVGVVLARPLIFWLAAALIPIGLILAKVLTGMGYGARPPQNWSERVYPHDAGTDLRDPEREPGR